MNAATITFAGFTGFLGRGAAPRELQCLMAVAAGKTSKEAARDLGIAPDSIDKRILALTTKLGVTRRAALVAEAFRRGLITPACLLGLAVMIAITGVQQQQLTARRPETPRRAEMRVAQRRADDLQWAA